MVRRGDSSPVMGARAVSPIVGPTLANQHIVSDPSLQHTAAASANSLPAVSSGGGGASLLIAQSSRMKRLQALLGGTGSYYNTVHTEHAAQQASAYSEAFRNYFRQRSSSMSEEQAPVLAAELLASCKSPSSSAWSFMGATNIIDATPRTVASEQDIHDRNCRLLNPALAEHFEGVKRAYAEILYRWSLLNQRSLVLKCTTADGQQTKQIAFGFVCTTCSSSGEQSTPQCGRCKQFLFKCAICEMAVKGLSTVCLYCGHGGHIRHVAEWFAKFSRCPTGCGCLCVQEQRGVFS